MSRNSWRSRSAGVAIAAAALLAAVWWATHRTEFYREFVRPDGRYRIVVMRQMSLAAAMPGQAGDSPGQALLLDDRGRVLHETDVSMVQLVDRVDWTPGHVAIKLVADWPLPD